VSGQEIRYRVIAALLQAAGPLTLAELEVESGVSAESLHPVLRELVDRGRVVVGELVPGRPVPQVRWAARWQGEAKRREVDVRQEAASTVRASRPVPDRELEVDSEPSRVLYRHVIDEYRPPPDKRYLVFLQC